MIKISPSILPPILRIWRDIHRIADADYVHGT